MAAGRLACAIGLSVFMVIGAVGMPGCGKEETAEEPQVTGQSRGESVADRDAYWDQQLKEREHFEGKAWLANNRVPANSQIATYVNSLYSAGAGQVEVFAVDIGGRAIPEAIVVILPAEAAKREKVLAVGAQINGQTGEGDAPIPDKGQKYLYLGLS